MGLPILYHSLRALFNLKSLWQRHNFDVWHYFSCNGDGLSRFLRSPHRRRELEDTRLCSASMVSSSTDEATYHEVWFVLLYHGSYAVYACFVIV